MLKGIQRQMMVVRIEKSEIFETAYFVIRADAADRSESVDIVSEANRIVSQVCCDSIKQKKESGRIKLRRVLFFILGTFSGGAIVSALIFLVEMLR